MVKCLNCSKVLVGYQKKFCCVECQGEYRAKKKRERQDIREATILTGIKMGDKIIWIRHHYGEDGKEDSVTYEVNLEEKVEMSDYFK